MDPLRRISLIQSLYAHEGWREVVAPLLTERKRAMEYALRNPSLLKQHDVPPDYARGILDIVDLLLDGPPQEAASLQASIEEDLLEKQRHEHYDNVADLGYGSGLSLLTDDYA